MMMERAVDETIQGELNFKLFMALIPGQSTKCLLYCNAMSQVHPKGA